MIIAPMTTEFVLRAWRKPVVAAEVIPLILLSPVVVLMSGVVGYAFCKLTALPPKPCVVGGAIAGVLVFIVGLIDHFREFPRGTVLFDTSHLVLDALPGKPKRIAYTEINQTLLVHQPVYQYNVLLLFTRQGRVAIHDVRLEGATLAQVQQALQERLEPTAKATP